jgi:hypothetical protein
MSIQRTPKNAAKDIARQMWPKAQPRPKRPKNPNEAKTREIVGKRSGGWCEMCGIARANSVHHRRNRSQGGVWSPANCVDVCGDGTRKCHGWATENPAAAHEIGFHLENGEMPELTAIVSGLHGRVLLDDEGGIRQIGGAA